MRITIFSIFSLTIIVNAQQITSAKIDSLPSGIVDTTMVSVVFADSAFQLPDTILAKGKIIEVTFVPASCGLFCWWGTAKLDLSTQIKGYPHKELYLAVLCFLGKKEDYIGQSVEVVVTKFFTLDVKQKCNGIFNSIDSKSIPFYKVVKDKKGLLDKIH